MVDDFGRCQTTLSRSFELAGIGLHGGLSSRLSIVPATADTGVVFECPEGSIPALLAFVSDASRCTAISNGEARIETIEHVLASLFALGVTNATVRVLEGVEAPVLDGSAMPIAQAILEAGIEAIPGTRRKQVRVRDALYVQREGSYAIALPHNRLRATVIVEFPQPVGPEVVDAPDVREQFVERIGPARTPGFVREWEMLKSRGLALGASADNVLPIHDEGYGDELRVPNEVGAHKLLDLVGDLALVGVDIAAHIITYRGGHALNHALGRAILESTSVDE